MKMKAGLGNQEYKWVEDFRRIVKVKSVEKLTECWWLHLLLSPGSPHTGGVEKEILGGD